MKYLICMLCAAWTIQAHAHGPTPQKTDQSLTIPASADAIWKQLSGECALANWHPQVARCEQNGPLKRVLTLRNGGKISEEIDEILPGEWSISYRLGSATEIEALPVSSLTGRIKLKVEGTNTQVSWMARYYRVDTTNEPPKGKDDPAAKAAVDAYVKAGLEGLAASVAAKK